MLYTAFHSVRCCFAEVLFMTNSTIVTELDSFLDSIDDLLVLWVVADYTVCDETKT